MIERKSVFTYYLSSRWQTHGTPAQSGMDTDF